jgi:hypothetical protein
LAAFCHEREKKHGVQRLGENLCLCVGKIYAPEESGLAAALQPFGFTEISPKKIF